MSSEHKMAGHIDVHIHALPPAYKEAVKAHGGDPSGFPEPEWSPEGALKSMEAVGSSLGKQASLLLFFEAYTHTHTRTDAPPSPRPPKASSPSPAPASP